MLKGDDPGRCLVAEDLKKFTAEELTSYDGEGGRPIYIAHGGRVIDVTASRMWKGGQHMKRHAAGQDLTAEIGAAPHGVDVLDRFPQVGILVREEAAATGHAKSGFRAALGRFFDRHPFLQRHPHPMTVHFPIVLFIFAPLFTLLFLLTGVDGFEFTAVSCLGAGLLSCLVVIPTGFLTWWTNYDARPMKPVTIKIVLSFVLFLMGGAVFLWRLLDPTIVRTFKGSSVAYIVLMVLLLPIVAVIASYGATLTFPVHKKERVSNEKEER
jgi:predicted heme/steroid binding protein/uncharacterized membrane protein